MALTPEQKQAHDALDEAIKKILELQGVAEGPLPMLVDWLIVVEGIRYEDDGDSVGYHNIVFRGGQCRLSVALGLLEIGSGLLEGED